MAELKHTNTHRHVRERGSCKCYENETRNSTPVFIAASFGLCVSECVCMCICAYVCLLCIRMRVCVCVFGFGMVYL